MKPKPKPTEREQLISELTATLPTKKELCLIAATLALGRQLDGTSAKSFADQAVALWDACGKTLAATISDRVDWQLRINAHKAEMPSVPVAFKFPVPLKVFLRVAGRKREDDRLRLYRAYLRAYWPKDVDAIIARDRREGFSEANYSSAATQFLRWLKNHRSESNRTRASAGGKGKKAKREAEKAKKREESLLTPRTQ